MKQKKLVHHHIYYTLLILILIGGVLAAIGLSYDRKLQTLVLIITAFVYSILGMIHHTLNHDFSLKIMIEYVLMGSLGMVIVLFLLKGGFL